MRSSSGYGPYRKKYYEGDPWHLKPFLEGKRVTFPYEHDSVILYTGVNKHIFFHEESDKRYTNSRNPRSVLNQGVLKPGNIGGRDAGSDELNGIHTKGTYFGTVPVAKRYAKKWSNSSEVGGAVLEIQIPTDILVTIIEKDFTRKEITEYAREHGEPPDQNEIIKPKNGLKKLKNKYGSPEGFRRELIDEESLGQKGEGVQWLVRPEIPLKNITGVWDVENSRKPIFTSFNDFLKTLKSQYTEHVPTESNHRPNLEVEEERKAILNESKEYKEILENVESLDRRVYYFGQRFQDMDREGFSEDYERGFRDKIGMYNEKREKLSELLETEFGMDDSKPKILLRNLRKNLDQMEKQMTEIEEGLKEAIADEQEYYHKENWSKEDIKKQQFFEERVEKKFGEMILQLPFIEYEDLEEIKANIQ